MSVKNMGLLADVIASLFLETKLQEKEWSWGITKGQIETDEDVVVVVLRRKKKGYKAATLPAGRTCPTCRGSGTV